MGHIKDNIVLGTNEKLYVMKDILASMASDNPSDEVSELFGIGEGKGIPFEFKENETISFDKFEDLPLIVRVVKIGSKEYKVLSTEGNSNLRGDIEVPLAIFRRTPALQEDVEKLVNKYPLSETLLTNSMGDITRMQLLSSKKILIEHVLYLPKITFVSVNGKVEKEDTTQIPPEKRKTMRFYQVKFVK